MASRQGTYDRLRRRYAQELARYSRRPYFASDDVHVGLYPTFGRNVRFNCKHVIIGDGAIIEDNVRVDAESFEVGDYAHIYEDCFFPGPGTIKIGHNFWLGRGAILDAVGDARIGNNVGIGAYSQLWTHILYGDVAYGCRFDRQQSLDMEDDSVLHGHCVVMPVKIGTRAMALPGAVITKDMLPDRTYVGCPAEDRTDRIGPQFDIRPVDERKAYVEHQVAEFAQHYSIHPIDDYVIVETEPGSAWPRSERRTVLNVADRTYLKQSTQLEHDLMRFLLPRSKFLPFSLA